MRLMSSAACCRPVRDALHGRNVTALRIQLAFLPRPCECFGTVTSAVQRGAENEQYRALRKPRRRFPTAPSVVMAELWRACPIVRRRVKCQAQVTALASISSMRIVPRDVFSARV
ncbi:hypothetical protein ACK3TF_003431 [Chlorella vulgaris]